MEEIEEVFRIFETLQSLGDGDLSKVMKDLDRLDKANKRANYVNFERNFPLLFLVAFSRRSSTLTTTVISQAFKEIVSFKNMIKPEETNIVTANFMTKD